MTQMCTQRAGGQDQWKFVSVPKISTQSMISFVMLLVGHSVDILLSALHFHNPIIAVSFIEEKTSKANISNIAISY